MKLRYIIIASIFTFGFFSCNSSTQNDSEVEAAINANLIGDASVEVKDGVAIITGTFEDKKSQDNAIEDAENTFGVKSVIDNSTVLGSMEPNELLDSAVSSIIRPYKDVSAQVQDSTITLSGSIEEKNLNQMLDNLKATNPKKINNNLLVIEEQY